MAPDKIYLQHNTTTDLYDEFWPEWFESTHHPERDICYIRKDALLEWAKETKAEPEKQNVINDDIRKGAIWELEEVIEKLNSM